MHIHTETTQDSIHIVLVKRFCGNLSESRRVEADLNFTSDLCLTLTHKCLIETSNSLKLSLYYSPSISSQLLLSLPDL